MCARITNTKSPRCSFDKARLLKALLFGAQFTHFEIRSITDERNQVAIAGAISGMCGKERERDSLPVQQVQDCCQLS